MLLSAKYIYVFGPTFHGALVEVGAVILVAPGSLPGISQPVHGVFIGKLLCNVGIFYLHRVPVYPGEEGSFIIEPIKGNRV